MCGGGGGVGGGVGGGDGGEFLKIQVNNVQCWAKIRANVTDLKMWIRYRQVQ